MHILVLISDLNLSRSPIGVTELYLYGGTRGTTELILVQRYPYVQQSLYFNLIRYSDSYHITVGIPRPVIRNE